MKDILKAINGILNPAVPYLFTRCKDPGLDKALLNFENGCRVRNYKFGILYCKEGQTNEDDMFANSKLIFKIISIKISFSKFISKLDEGSEDYNQFLDFIGNKIPLKGWKKFRAGLDVHGLCSGFFFFYESLTLFFF